MKGAAWFLVIFGVAAYYLPTIMLAVGDYSATVSRAIGNVSTIAPAPLPSVRRCIF